MKLTPRKHWPQWLRDADTKYAQVTVDPNGYVTWHGGEWCDGEWIRGTWEGGDWLKGTWHSGIWKDGTWHGGTWYGSHWLYGTWNGGEWLNGKWGGGEWHGGTWHYGIWYNGEWVRGDWLDGVWHGGEWRSGIWKNGRWLGGDCISSPGILAALVGWNGHGQWGRTLRAVRYLKTGKTYFSCGCFYGTEEQLDCFIRQGDASLAESRRKAMDIVMGLVS